MATSFISGIWDASFKHRKSMEHPIEICNEETFFTSWPWLLTYIWALPITSVQVCSQSILYYLDLDILQLLAQIQVRTSLHSTMRARWTDRQRQTDRWRQDDYTVRWHSVLKQYYGIYSSIGDMLSGVSGVLVHWGLYKSLHLQHHEECC